MCSNCDKNLDTSPAGQFARVRCLCELLEACLMLWKDCTYLSFSATGMVLNQHLIFDWFWVCCAPQVKFDNL